MPLSSVLCPSSITTEQPQESNQEYQVGSSAQLVWYETESDEGNEEQIHQSSTGAALLGINTPHPTEEESHKKRLGQSGMYCQLQQRMRSGIRRSIQQQELVLVSESAETEMTVAADTGEGASVASLTQETSATEFAQEIENEAAEIRSLIARTAQLWSAIDQAQHTQGPPSQQPMRSIPAPAQRACIEDENSIPTNSNENIEDEDEETETETESVDMVLDSMTRLGSFFSDESIVLSSSCISSIDTLSSRSLEEQESIEERLSGLMYDSEDLEEDSDVGIGRWQLEHGETIDALNRTINASKACAIKEAMLGNLLLLNFHEDITRGALEAGVLEIDHYDSDCELAFVDIFMLLVKMVSDAHIDAMNKGGDVRHSYADISNDNEQADSTDANSTSSLEHHVFFSFKWPVFDMAQFEFGSARPGTCFDSVCVLTNLPKVSVDRTGELMEILSCNLFSMIGDPIQVVIPSARSMRRTKGHAFLEFDDPEMAQRCAWAVDGLTWGRGPFCRIRGNLFRQYQVKTSVGRQRLPSLGGDRASIPTPRSGAPRSESSRIQTFDYNENRSAWRRGRRASVEQQNLICNSDEECSDIGEWVDHYSFVEAQLRQSPLRDLSSGCVDAARQPSWDDEVLTEGRLMQQSECGFVNDESFGVLVSERPDERELADESPLHNIARGCRYDNSSLSDDMEEPSSTVTPTGFATTLADSDDRIGHAWDEKPWRRYFEDLIVRNHEMQKQLALARGRIHQLRHNNQKLHWLLDRVERDREGCFFENNLLQTQLHEYEDHDHRDSLTNELVSSQNRVAQQTSSSCECRLESQELQTPVAVDSSLKSASTALQDIRAALSRVLLLPLAQCRFEDLKEWEQELEKTLSRVRSVKEEKAVEMQKQLDRQVIEQHELKLCVICLSDEKSVLCLPCRHLCLCKMCSRRQEVAKCPICRLEIDEMLAVYS